MIGENLQDALKPTNEILRQIETNTRGGGGGWGAAIFALFGGPAQFDCWLTKTADLLADPAQCPPGELPPVIPYAYQELMHRPHEVLDCLLANLETIQAFAYRLRESGGVWEVRDCLSGCVVETRPAGLGVEAELHEKYGPKVEVDDGLAD